MKYKSTHVFVGAFIVKISITSSLGKGKPFLLGHLYGFLYNQNKNKYLGEQHGKKENKIHVQ